jgi:hypothetical protein
VKFRKFSVALAVSALITVGLSTVAAPPANAAVPPAPTRVTVTTTANGSQFVVSWPRVSNAAGYLIYVNRRYRATVWQAKGVTTYRTTVGGEALDDIMKAAPMPVVTVTSVYRTSAGALRNGGSRDGRYCPKVMYIAVRGSGQNPYDDAGTAGYAYGLGDRGKRVWDNVKAQLGLGSAAIPARGVFYPADAIAFSKIFWGAAQVKTYNISRDSGVENLTSQLNNLASPRICPSTRTIVFGYSQGADVVGQVWQGNKLTTAARTNIVYLLMFADPQHNPFENWAGSVVNRPLSATYLGSLRGVIGLRPTLSSTWKTYQPPATTSRILASWCSEYDDVCALNERNGLQFHNDRYDCYEKRAAYEVADAVKTRLWKSGTPRNPAKPTCRIES